MVAGDDPGFQIINGVLTPETCDAILKSLGSGNARHLMRTPAVAALAAHPQLVDIAVRWIGSTAIPFRATLFDKAGLRNWFVAWHQDATLPLKSKIESNEWGPWSTKAGVLHARAPASALNRIVALRVHLDASSPDNGPLRVIPGSHRLGVLSSEEALRVAHQGPAMECLAERGGIIAMRPLLIHASSKADPSRPPRRVVHIEYADSLDLAPGTSLALS